MDPLTESLRDLDPPAPPTAVDLDRVIARGLRRRSASRLVSASGAALVVVLGVATTAAALRPAGAPPPGSAWSCRTVPTVVASAVMSASAVPSFEPRPTLSGSGGPGSSGSAGARPGASVPAPSEPADRAIDRLTRTLRAALATAFPGATIVDSGTCDANWRLLAVDHGYGIDLEVYDTGGLQRLTVHISRMPSETIHSCDARYQCTDDVPLQRSVAYTFGTGFGTGAEDTDVRGYLPDGTMVAADLSTYHREGDSMIVTRQGLSASNDALKRLVLTPGLTLYP